MDQKNNSEYLSPKNITYRNRLVFCVISLLPLVIMTYLSYKYIFPVLEDDTLKISVISIIILSVFLSLFGYLFSQRDSTSIIKAMGKTNRDLATLCYVVNTLSSTTHIDVVLKEIIESSVKLLEGESSALFLRKNGSLICSGIAGPAMNRNKGKEVQISGGPYEAVIMGRSTSVVNRLKNSTQLNLSSAGRTALSQEWFDPAASSLICSPLIYHDEAIGILEVFNKREGKVFDESDKRLLENLASQASISIKNAEFYEEQNNFSTHMLELLVTSMEENVAWEGHLHNVARYANLISRKLNLSESERKNIHFGALLHDIGMLKIDPVSRAIPEEFQKHPVIGSEMIKPITIWKEIHPLILYHHEDFDGSGYPGRLVGEAIPLGARIIHIAEAYDTLTNEETYSGVLNHNEALRELEKCAGSKYDPNIIKIFLDALAEQ